MATAYRKTDQPEKAVPLLKKIRDHKVKQAFVEGQYNNQQLDLSSYLDRFGYRIKQGPLIVPDPKYQTKVKEKLEKIRTGIKQNKNVLELAVNAARVGATVGEISNAMEEVWDRHKAEVTLVKNTYANNFSSEKIDYIRKRTKDFEAKEHRKPKVFIAKLGQDGHDRGQKVVASALVDMGFDIEVGSLFQTPSEVAELVLKTESDIVAASSLAAGHLTLVPQLKDELNIRGLENIHIVVGGVIPKDDFSALLDSGASAIFATGTNIVDAAAELLNILEIK